MAMFTNQMRMTGFSGLDVADMVNQMMRAESTRLNRLQQQRQIFQWQQDMLRDVSSNIMSFRNRWTNTSALLAGTGISSTTSFTGLSANITGAGAAGVRVTTNANATQRNHTLHVQNLAQADTFRSAGNVNTGSVSSGIDASRISVNSDGKLSLNFNMTVNGVNRAVTLNDDAIRTALGNDLADQVIAERAKGSDADFTAINKAINENAVVDVEILEDDVVVDTESFDGTGVKDRLVTELNKSLVSAFGRNPVPDGSPAGTLGGARVVADLTDDGSLRIKASTGNTASVQSNVAALGLSSGSAALDVSAAGGVGRLLGFDPDAIPANTSFTISQGGRDFTITANSDWSVQRLMNEVNNTAGLDARLSFSENSGQFTLESTRTGAAGALTFSDTNVPAGEKGFFEAAGLSASAVRDESAIAKDAVFTLNGQLMSRESNTFTEYGMTITISADAVGRNTNINLETNVTSAREHVVNFVNAYNDIVRELQELANNPRPRQLGGKGFFMPLGDEEKRHLSESEVRQWEEQARTGLLHRDDMLRRILSDMRQEMERVVTVNGQNISLANIGILPSRNVSQGGILEINMEALDKALADNMEGVAGLFTGEGVTHVDGRAVSGTLRGGIGARLDTALNRYVTEWGTGELSDRAGIVGRPSQHNNAITRQIQDQDRRIDDMMNWLQRREAALFKQFSRLEVAMLQSQQQMMFWDQIMWGG